MMSERVCPVLVIHFLQPAALNRSLEAWLQKELLYCCTASLQLTVMPTFPKRGQYISCKARTRIKSDTFQSSLLRPEVISKNVCTHSHTAAVERCANLFSKSNTAEINYSKRTGLACLTDVLLYMTPLDY